MSMGDRGAETDATRTDGTRRQNSNRRTWLPWVLGASAVVVVAGIVLALTLSTKSDTAGVSTSSPTSAPSSGESGSSASAAASADTQAPATSETAGGSDQFPELRAVDPREPGVAAGISVVLSKFESVTGEVVGPGDVAAAAVRVTVDITNSGPDPLDLDLVVMNAYMGVPRDPAETYEQPGGSPVSGSLAPGDTIQGVYLFRIPDDRRDDVTFVIDYRAGQPAITWRGQVP